MGWSFPVGHLFGSELRVHVTFFLVLAWVGGTVWLESGPAAAAVSLVYVIVLFACVVAHEFGHALTARRFGIRTPDVTLLPIGGIARLERMPEKPREEILVALAGPAVNVVIFAVLFLVLGSGAFVGLDPSHLSFADLPAQIATLNLALAVFNLLPAFPMDGGRVLRAVLALTMERAAATRVAATAGQAFALAMGIFGLIAGNPFLLLIAFFVFISAGSERADEAVKTLARGLMARDAMITEFETLAPDDSLDAAAATLIRTTQHEFPVVDPASGAAVGLLTRAALYRALDSGPRARPVTEAMQRGLPVVALHTGLGAVLERMQTGAPAIGVAGADGVLVGYITRENIGELMVVTNGRSKLR